MDIILNQWSNQCPLKLLSHGDYCINSFLKRIVRRLFKTWFQSRLPRNGAELTFENAIEVVGRKLGKNQEPIYFFLGVDEYQKIEKIGTRRKDPNTSLLRELVDTIADFMCSKSSNLVLLPMFAGTDLSVIASGSIANSSYYVTRRLPMSLLTLDQVYSIVESNQNFAELLHYKRICVHLFSLGGVPRWVVDYLIELKKCIIPGECLNVNTINGCYDTIVSSFVDAYMSSLEMSKFVRLAAFAISSLLVSPNDEFCEGTKWSRLRDSSLCVLVRYEVGLCRVEVPYTLLHCLGKKSLVDRKSDAELHFMNALKDLIKYVDNNLLFLQPWQLWEMFGACFYAMRINALLVLGQSTVTLEQLLPGALMTSATGSISVDLVPLKIFQCAEQFGVSTPAFVSNRHNQKEKVDWTSGGYIVVNGDGGAGVDLFFALKESATGQVVVIVDQRKLESGRFYPGQAAKYLEKLDICPSFLKTQGARLVRGVVNCIAPSSLATTFDVPENCFLVSKNETVSFHGTTLAYHPACSPIVSINSACKTSLKTIFRGNVIDVNEAVDEVVEKRKEGGFRNREDVLSLLHDKGLKVELIDERVEFSS